MQFLKLAVLASFSLFSGIAVAGETSAPDNAKVYFVNLKDGDKVKSPFLVQFGLSGMDIAPAGIDKENTGHHHLIIDEEVAGDELNAPIPVDDKHRHFGKGQTEVNLELPSGEHTLQLLLGDWNHIPHNPPVMSERIKIIVE